MEKQLAELQEVIPKAGKLNEKVSRSEVGWHVDHSLKVLNNICLELKKSSPEDYKPSFSFKKLLVLTLGKIPRGIAKAPKGVRPPMEIKEEELYIQLENAKSLLDEIKRLPEKSNFEHPYFGRLDLKTSIKFMRIHTEHHLKIIRDILTN
ncbi:hypothetical protein V6R21_12535 [Limibacter armeniacum]|uniref:hypothetical protein n=1 Tax=Limibacter armeniacum TaxID=466084 RepID=UPI002FE5AD75